MTAPPAPPAAPSAKLLRDARWMACRPRSPRRGGADIVVRAAEHYEGLRGRANYLSLTSELEVAVASPDDCAFGWYPRDLDHLALQRAVRLAKAHNLMP